MPDIIILQEVDEKWINNINKVKEKYPYFIEAPRVDNFGISIYSKIPLKNSEIQYWTNNFEVPVIASDIEFSGKNIRIYCVHTLPPANAIYFEARNEMLQKINAISKIKTKEVIFAGDLNSTVYSWAYKEYIAKSGLLDAQIGAKTIIGTWNAFHPLFLRIPLEHILFSEGLELNSFKVGEGFGSDHLPVFVTFGILGR